MRVPRSTFRVQLHAAFGFQDARSIVPLLARLGIGDLYASPIFHARQGSTHGYDVTNPNCLNPELGTTEDFDALAAELKAHGMGLLVDIVPNHMAASPENPWWTDLLENGSSSTYAGFFAVQWEYPGQTHSDRIYLPILGDLYGAVLENGQLQLGMDECGLCVRYYASRLPLAPTTYAEALPPAESIRWDDEPSKTGYEELLRVISTLPARNTTDWDMMERRRRDGESIKSTLWSLYQSTPALREAIDQHLCELNGLKGQPATFERLDALLGRQAYQPAYFAVAKEKINYRRFFDVNELISLRMEDAQVFRASHALALRLLQQGSVTGLRIDHVDGLLNPCQYLERLQAEAGQDAYVVVEKITLGAETLPSSWPVAGTTGYDFLAACQGLFVDPAGLERIVAFYQTIAGECCGSYEDLSYRNKKRLIESSFDGEMQSLALTLTTLAESDRYARDFSPRELQRALIEVTASFPVYRTYIDGPQIREADRAAIEKAIALARERNPALHSRLFHYVRQVLLLECHACADDPQHTDWLRFVQRWQQISGPITAKGVEDTTFYQFNPVVSMNEVGCDFRPFSLEQFHQFNSQRARDWPHTLNATSTHDTKRSEDVRCRIHLLTELAEPWIRTAQRWSRWNREHRRRVDGQIVPDRNEEFALYQQLLGAWPLCEPDRPAFQDRLDRFIEKWLREGKLHSQWSSPHTDYENALQQFARNILTPAPSNRFLPSFHQWSERLSFHGAMNSLSQLLLKIASPGVPDFYQASLLWDLSMVDPDNRRPVDYQQISHLLDLLGDPAADPAPSLLKNLLEDWSSGALKTFVSQRGLCFRNQHAELFASGEYLPLTVDGPRANHVVAFLRRHQGQSAIVVAPRLMTQLSVFLRPALGRRIWRDTRILLPVDCAPRWKNAFTGQTVSGAGDALPVAEVLSTFPVALLSNA